LLCQESNEFSYTIILDSISINFGLGQSEKNIQYIKELESKEALQKLDCRELGMIYHKLGQAYYILSDHMSAYTSFTSQAIPIWKDCILQSKIEEAHSYYAASLSGQFLNYFDEAISLMNYALELYESDSTYTQFNIARKYHGAGLLYSNIKDYELAEIYYGKSIDIFLKSEKAGRYLSQVYNDLGVIYQNRQEYHLAIQQYEKSLDQNDLFKTDNLHNISNAYIDLEDYENAKKYALLTYNSALESGDATTIARTLELVGFVQYLLNNQAEALEAYQNQIDILKADVQNNETVRYLAKAHENIALCYLKLNQFDLAILANQQALDYMFFEEKVDQYQNPIIYENNTRNELETIDILSTKTDILKAKEKSYGKNISPKAEIDLYFKIDSLFLRVLSDVSFTRSKFYLLNTINPLYEKAISSLIENYFITEDLNYFNKAYYFASRLKAITLRSSIRKETILSPKDNKVLLDHHKNIDSLKLIYYNSIESSDSISSKIIKHQRLIHDYEMSLNNKYPELLNTSIENIGNTEYQELRKQLPKDKLLVEYFNGDSSVYSFFIAKDTFGVFKIKLDNEVQDLLNLFEEANHSPTLLSIHEYRKISNEVYNILFAPFTDYVNDGIQKILIIPDGILHSIPFEALCNDSLDFILHDYEISYAYSVHLKASKSTNESKGYVGFAANYTKELNNKILEHQATKTELILSDIPLAIQEIKTSAKIFDGVSILNEQATKKAFLKYSKNAKIIHLSLHGIVDYEVPENSNLLFNDMVEDFILHSSEISNLELHSDLVVLSACQSGAGKRFRNVGVQGISRSFLLAGTSSVISSLWDASDYVSSLVLPLFFQQYVNGNSKSSSLQLAKIEYLKSSRPSLHHPFYWSNLILIVNPSNDFEPGFSFSKFKLGGWIIFGAVSLFLFLIYFIWIKRKNK